MAIDYQSYEWEQLLSCLENINKEKYPENFERLLSELQKKKPDDYEIIRDGNHVDIRYVKRVDVQTKENEKKSVAPKFNYTGSSHQPMSFTQTVGSIRYIKNFWKVMSPMFPVVLPIAVIFSDVFDMNVILMVIIAGLCIFSILLLISAALYFSQVEFISG